MRRIHSRRPRIALSGGACSRGEQASRASRSATERHQARSVAYRVLVNVGTVDYPCGRKETPHFLEHLLFNGTSQFTESELDDLVEEHGGSWNAYTYQESTDYALDIFSKYAPLGLEILYEIITDSLITQESVERSQFYCITLNWIQD